MENAMHKVDARDFDAVVNAGCARKRDAFAQSSLSEDPGVRQTSLRNVG
jgi:hypothetical protein